MDPRDAENALLKTALHECRTAISLAGGNNVLLERKLNKLTSEHALLGQQHEAGKHYTGLVKKSLETIKKIIADTFADVGGPRDFIDALRAIEEICDDRLKE